MTDPAPRFRDKPVSFVRRSGRMSDAQERAWQDLSAHYVIDVERDAAATSVRPGTQIAPGVVFGRRAPLVVEIGSGQGHAIVHAASTSPERDFLAVEVFRAGLARTMLDADRAGATNLRLVEANAPEVLEHLLPEGSVDELWIFFPTPGTRPSTTSAGSSRPPSPRSRRGCCAMAGSCASRPTGRTTPCRCAT